MFTGQWPHELAVEWMSPLRGDVPTLAEHLGSLGYATAGFVGNTFYASYDTGLDRGFTHYEDYVLDGLNAARTAKALDDSFKSIGELGRMWHISGRAYQDLTRGERKDARAVNREFLEWLARRRAPRRPFFAFLNYVDAHSPYLLPPGVSNVLGGVPITDRDVRLLGLRWSDENRRRFPGPARQLARDAYDNCLAYVDARLGELVDELERRGVLEQTLVIVTADHGEELGEHALFDHGESLYRAEIRVPLVIVPPAGRDRSPRPAVVDSPVSLRDLAATVAGFVRPGTTSPFPGRSLLEGTRATAADSGAGNRPEDDAVVLSELSSPNPADPNRGRSPAHRGSLISLAEGDLVYIRNQGDGGEELFNERDDPDELHNLARAAAMGPSLRSLRERARRVTGRAGTSAMRAAGGWLDGAIDDPTGAGGPGLDRGAGRDGGHRGHRVVARRPVSFLAARRPSAGDLVAVRQHPAGRPLRGGRVLRPLPCRDRRELSPPPDGPLARPGRRGGDPGPRRGGRRTPLVRGGGAGILDRAPRRPRLSSRDPPRASGRVVARNEAEVRFVLGSGKLGASFLIDRDGFLFQSPISWYARQGRWDLSSGYRGRNPHFDRAVIATCLYCHANRVEPVEETVNRYAPPTFRGHAIGCERCHGPGALHVVRPAVEGGVDATIVNPAALEPALRDAVCEQCHLMGQQRVIKLDRRDDDFRPGLPFYLVWSVFEWAEGAATDKFVGQVEQMHESRCYRASSGGLGCISCHDPHRQPADLERAGYYRGRCLECHGEDQRGCRLTEASRRKRIPKTTAPPATCRGWVGAKSRTSRRPTIASSASPTRRAEPPPAPRAMRRSRYPPTAIARWSRSTGTSWTSGAGPRPSATWASPSPGGGRGPPPRPCRGSRRRSPRGQTTCSPTRRRGSCWDGSGGSPTAWRPSARPWPAHWTPNPPSPAPRTSPTGWGGETRPSPTYGARLPRARGARSTMPIWPPSASTRATGEARSRPAGTALRLNPMDLESRERLVRALLHAGDRSAAREEFRILLDFDPPNRAELFRRFSTLR